MKTSSPIGLENDETDCGSEGNATGDGVGDYPRRRSASLAFILTLCLPVVLLFFNIACTPRRTLDESFRQVNGLMLIDLDCLAIVLGWLLVQLFLFLLPIGSKRRNGVFAFFLSLGSVYVLDWFGIIRASYVYDNISKMLVASILVSLFIGLLLFVKGTYNRRLQLVNPMTAFFYGIDINPIIAGIDLKVFFELRAGLIGWACLNLCFFIKTTELYTYHRPPVFVLIAIQQIFYALQLLWYEEDRIPNKSIKKEPIGFVHIFGSLCWLPFLWCLSSQFLTLVNYPIKRLYIIGSILFSIIGMIIYRHASNQRIILKNLRKNTESTLLLDVEPMWPSYISNLLIFVSWSLPCGGASLIPWMLPIYYLIVIFNATQIDNRLFRRKYPTQWRQYDDIQPVNGSCCQSCVEETIDVL